MPPSASTGFPWAGRSASHWHGEQVGEGTAARGRAGAGRFGAPWAGVPAFRDDGRRPAAAEPGRTAGAAGPVEGDHGLLPGPPPASPHRIPITAAAVEVGGDAFRRQLGALVRTPAGGERRSAAARRPLGVLREGRLPAGHLERGLRRRVAGRMPRTVLRGRLARCAAPAQAVPTRCPAREGVPQACEGGHPGARTAVVGVVPRRLADPGRPRPGRGRAGRGRCAGLHAGDASPGRRALEVGVGRRDAGLRTAHGGTGVLPGGTRDRAPTGHRGAGVRRHAGVAAV